jgi:hypothetical protein
MVIGSAAMHLYEASAGAFLSRSIVVDGDLDLLSTAKTPLEAFEELLPVIRRADKSFELLSNAIRNCPLCVMKNCPHPRFHDVV